jgi:tripartite ATP-independent transporter DctM subunit
VLVLFLVVIGGIYLGVFSPTEAAGVGAFGAFIFALCRRRLSWGLFKLSLVETAKTTAMIFLIIIGAMVLGYFLAVTRIPFELAGFISGLQVSRHIILGLILLVYLFLGCIMDALAMILLTVPIFFPLVMALGFDPIWFGVIIIRVFEIGIITPPVGMNVFVIKGVAPEIPLDTIFRGIIPFLIADICLVALLIAVPQFSLYLPSFMK